MQRHLYRLSISVQECCCTFIFSWFTCSEVWGTGGKVTVGHNKESDVHIYERSLASLPEDPL